ncbi:MAG TPA: NAD(P)H-hydrate epimerase [Balneolaceae bacterium]|nr:NAD(P)H-hydrate epimerase [Balneolaceae bacterium]|tara:strand:- start:40226 stop:41725 length:1500 start_codon:yes stop_codon:yes gene_type:complete
MLKIPHSYQLFTAASSRKLDADTINEFGISGITLMEIAGTRAADFILSEMEAGSHGLFLCGKGNNAGDALVVARILAEHDFECTVVFIKGSETLSDDSSVNLKRLRELGKNVRIHHHLDDFDRSAAFDFIVDGMLGTGLNSDIRSPYDSVIEWVNETEIPVFAMDIPTGLHADSGKKMGNAVIADFTLAFGSLKQGFFFDDGYEHCGEVIFCELPFPSKFKNETTFLIDSDWANNHHNTSQRKHKYDGGVVYIIAGSEGLTGAGVLAAKSAWATGVGAVVLISPNGLLQTYEEHLVQIIKRGVGTSNDKAFRKDHVDEVIRILNERPGKVLIGPGLGRDEETLSFTRELLSRFSGDLVIDADALFALASAPLEKPEDSNWILTPHPGELTSFIGFDTSSAQERKRSALQISTSLNVTILSKGLPSMLCTPEGVSYHTGYDTRVFSRAGFGDVLAGKTVAQWLITNDPELAGIFSLIDGKEKADSHILASSKPLEPIHLI